MDRCPYCGNALARDPVLPPDVEDYARAVRDRMDGVELDPAAPPSRRPVGAVVVSGRCANPLHPYLRFRWTEHFSVEVLPC